MIEKSVVTRCARRATKIACAGSWYMRQLKPVAHRRARYSARQKLTACIDYDSLDLSPKRLTAWDIA